MHQKFYIDADEEISSVIDRLNKSMAMDNYFVVPRRAAFLQSIVNLKLLKREAEKIGKNIVMITQDEIGISMAHRAGIDARPTLEGLETIQDAYSEKTDENDYSENEENIAQQPKVIEEVHNQDKQVRLKNIGSNDFYNAQSSTKENKNSSKVTKSLPRRIPINSANAASALRSNARKETTREILQKEIQQIQPHEERQSVGSGKLSVAIGRDIFRKESKDFKRIDPRKERSLEKIFSSSRGSAGKNESLSVPEKVHGRVKKIFYVFIVLCLLVFGGVAAYLLVPSAKIILVSNISKNKIEANIHGSGNNETGAENIAVRVIDENQDTSLGYEVTEKSSVSGKKANGTVVIYNEYSSSSQQLIATTRLQTSDGKIFRIVKNITVPGTTNVDGKTQPGAIEAEVVADQAGSDFNIDPTEFKIPGFADGPKFDKFYAKSSKSFSGGSLDGEEVSGPRKVTQQDIDNAKAKTETDAREKVDALIASKLKDGEIVLPEAKKITITKNTVNAKVGDMVSGIECMATASVRALVFSESDVKKILEQNLSDNSDKSQVAKKEITKIEYGSVDPNFDNSTLELKVHGETTTVPDINIEQIKKELLGKNSDQLGEILKKYSSIKNASVEFWPGFISRIPQYAQRVSIEVSAE